MQYVNCSTFLICDLLFILIVFSCEELIFKPVQFYIINFLQFGSLIDMSFLIERFSGSAYFSVSVAIHQYSSWTFILSQGYES